MNTPQNPSPAPEGGGKQKIIRIEGQVANPYQTVRRLNENDKVGPNRIIALIGEGGAASVYKVWHEGLEVNRAIKVIKTFGNKEAHERFITEAKILADIRHPNIIEIHNLGFLDQQYPFIEMEFIDGTSVKQIIARDKHIRLPAALAITYFVSNALQYAHTKDYTLYGNVYHGLIHRDIKPDNIVISKEGRVKLMDFGIARPSEVSLHTVGAKIMGTLVYLSPEQLNGQKLDHRSDIFSLGCVLYEMLAGERAFPQKTLADLVQKKTKGQYRPLTSFGHAIPAGVSAVVDKAMSLDPAERYQSAAEMSRDVWSQLRDVSDLGPAEVIAQYVRDPSSITIVKRKKSLPLPVVIGVAAVATALVMTILGYLVLHVVR